MTGHFPEEARNLLYEAFDQRGRKLVSVLCGAGRAQRCRRQVAVVWEMPNLDYDLFESPPSSGDSRSTSKARQDGDSQWRDRRKDQGLPPLRHGGYLMTVPHGEPPPFPLFWLCRSHVEASEVDTDQLARAISDARKLGQVVEIYALPD